jgi:guanylate kinase
MFCNFKVAGLKFKVMHGKFIIFSAPSGSGKTTIVKHLLESGLPIEFSISATSRQPRGEEKHGKDYYFLTTEEFKKRIKTEDFIEWEEVYQGNYYGTLKSEIQRIWALGKHVVFDIDVKGGVNLKNMYPDITLAIFIRPPSVEELEKRLIARSTDDEATIKKRISKAKEELGYAEKFDIVIVNDNLDEAKAKAHKVVSDFINKT